jgi:hypothetical protein
MVRSSTLVLGLSVILSPFATTAADAAVIAQFTFSGDTVEPSPYAATSLATGLDSATLSRVGVGPGTTNFLGTRIYCWRRQQSGYREPWQVLLDRATPTSGTKSH